MRGTGLLAPVVCALLAGLAGLTGCAGGQKPSDDLPAGDGLVQSAAETMRSLETVRFVIAASGSVSGIPLRKATGVITAAGDAEGSAQIDESGPLAELSFVVKGQTLYVKAITGGWQQVPLALASTVYDPSKILDPDQGLASVLATATGATTEARESIAGVDTYRVAARFSGTALGRLVPGISADVPGQVWIGTDKHLLYQGKFSLPNEGGKDPATITVTLADFDASVTIDAP